MAVTRYVTEATRQVDPLYQQQIKATQSQLPAIQNLYQSLTQGLQGQQAAETQNILESASQRGVLRSTLPVDLQTQLGAAFAQKRGELASQQARDISGVQQQISGIGLERVKTIQSLADALEARDLERQKFKQAQELARQEALAQQQAASARSYGGGGGGGGRAPSQAQITQQAASALAQQLRGVAGRDGYVSPQNYAAGKREWVAAGFTSKSYDDYFGAFRNPRNLNYKYY